MKCRINRPFKVCGCVFNWMRVLTLFNALLFSFHLFSLFSLTSFRVDEFVRFFFLLFCPFARASYNCVRIFVLIIHFVLCCSLCSVALAHLVIVLVSIISSVQNNEVQSNSTEKRSIFSRIVGECVYSAQH